jgi:formylglycine-generating enzyme required for sulfatase activity
VKYKIKNSNEWKHSTISNNNISTGGIGNNAVLEASADRRGYFFYRAQNGEGTFDSKQVEIVWDYGSDNIQSENIDKVWVFAVEVVKIPTGNYYLGDGASIGRFHSGNNSGLAYLVTSPTIQFGNSVGSCLADNTQATLPGGGLAPAPWDNFSGTLSSQFPNGYNSFWIMKNEVTMGQYCDFLNTLTSTQANNLLTNSSEMATNGAACNPCRFNIQTGTSYTTSSPSRAMNWLQWQDGLAFSDWAGLRPMTELEFEKANRGNLNPIPMEYSWGSTYIKPITSINGGDGSGTETANPTDANTHYSGFGNPGIGIVRGPVKVGLFDNNATRELKGQSYYGVNDLSGNVVEMCITVGNTNGRSFIANHGDGSLESNGNANVPGWPNTTLSTAQIPNGGWGFRGGDFWNPELDLRVSARNVATFSGARRLFGLGFRAVRSSN